jgi:hypothetical protein
VGQRKKNKKTKKQASCCKEQAQITAQRRVHLLDLSGPRVPVEQARATQMHPKNVLASCASQFQKKKKQCLATDNNNR